jgi:hypothetical protein
MSRAVASTASRRRGRALRGQRLHCHAARNLGAVATALAHRLVDQHPAARRFGGAALAPAAQLAGADLVVDNHGTAPGLAQLALERIHLVPVADPANAGQADVPVAGRIVRHYLDPRHALGAQLIHHGGHRKGTVHGLAAGHGHRVVEQNLVGNVDAGRYGLANGHGTGMEIRTLTQVLEYMGITDITALANPVNPFAAHLDQRFRVTAHPGRHKVTAYSGQRFTAFRYFS